MDRMETLGNVFVDVGAARIVIATLCYQSKHDHAMLGLRLDALLPICRASMDLTIRGCCLPYPTIAEPPYLCHDIQLCKTHDKREKMGYVWTASDQRGPAYQIVLDRASVLNRFGTTWMHLHEETEQELTERSAATFTHQEATR